MLSPFLASLPLPPISVLNLPSLGSVPLNTNLLGVQVHVCENPFSLFERSDEVMPHWQGAASRRE